MSRIIINNKSDISDTHAIELVDAVIRGGRVSNNGKQYCYYTVFNVLDKEIGVATDLRKKSDSFTVVNTTSENTRMI